MPERDTLVLIAVRQSSDPQATARQAMMAIMPIYEVIRQGSLRPGRRTGDLFADATN